MAVSFLIRSVGRTIGSILLAVFGWSVTALFGRLPRRKHLDATVALVLSLLWPVFFVGLFFPSVAGWAGDLPLRILCGALVFITPPIVGVLVHLAAPSKKTTTTEALFRGYPLVLGLVLAFLVTLVTVPLVKLVTIARGHADEHVFVKARSGRDDGVVHEIAEACARTGLEPEIVRPPAYMTIATKVLRLFARDAVTPILAEVRAGDVDLYLYPSDLLIRGAPERVARVRAMLTRTELDRDAYLVVTPAGQCVQDELGRLQDVLREHHEQHHDVGRLAGRRLVEIYREMNEIALPFDDWDRLEAIARRIERKLVAKRVGVAALPLDAEEDGLAKLAESMERSALKEEKEHMAIEHPTPERLPLEEASTRDLVREALDEAKELVRIEVALAKNEVKSELVHLKRAAIGFGISAVCALLLLSTLILALVIALGGTVVAALGVAAVLLVIGGIGAYAGYVMLPKKPLERTRNRLETNVNQLKEHFA